MSARAQTAGSHGRHEDDQRPRGGRSPARSGRGRARAGLLGLAALAGAALAVAGCDTGGLLVVESSTDRADAGPPIAQGPSALDFVSGGTVATSGKYRVVYTFGQPTPNAGVSKNADQRLNGGLVGAMNGQ